MLFDKVVGLYRMILEVTRKIILSPILPFKGGDVTFLFAELSLLRQQPVHRFFPKISTKANRLRLKS